MNLIREDLKPIRNNILVHPPITTIAESWQQARNQHRTRRHHVNATVNWDPKVNKLSLVMMTTGNAENTVISRLLLTPWTQVLPDYLHAAPIHLEILAVQGTKGILARLVRRGYPRHDNRTSSNQVWDLADFVFRIPYAPITIGPENLADREDYPDPVEVQRQIIAGTSLAQPLTMRILKEVFHAVSQFGVKLDGQRIELRNLFTGRELLWIGQSKPTQAQKVELPHLVNTFTPYPDRFAIGHEDICMV